MKELYKINILKKELQLYSEDNENYFSASEVGEMIGYSKSNISKMVAKVDEEEKTLAFVARNNSSKDKRKKGQWFIARNGFLDIVTNSKKITSDKKEAILKAVGICKEDIVLTYNRREIEFIETLLKILEPFDYECIKQFQVGKYRIDLYIKDLNIAIEFDEKSHSYYKYENEKGRQKNIEKELGCKFIRVNEKDSDLWNCGYILKNILEEK